MDHHQPAAAPELPLSSSSLETPSVSSARTPFRAIRSKNNHDNASQEYHYDTTNILRSRSLDFSNDNKIYNDIYNNNENSSYDDIASTATSLNSSFDAALLGKGSEEEAESNIFRSTASLSSTGTSNESQHNRVAAASSWDERTVTSTTSIQTVSRKHQTDLTDSLFQGSSTSRKHLRRGTTAFDETTPGRQLGCFGSSFGGGLPIRKFSSVIQQSQATPSSKSKRRKATPLQNRKIKSPYQIYRAPISDETSFQGTPMFPSSICKPKVMQTCNTATTANTSHTSALDLTIDTADQSHESPTSTPFRFSAFPASLPRVHPRASDYKLSCETPFDSGMKTCPNTTRKKMTFSGALGQQNADSSTHFKRARPMLMNLQDETGQNSSLSSMSGGDQYLQICQQHSFPPSPPSTLELMSPGCQSSNIARRIDTNFSDDSDTPEPRQTMPLRTQAISSHLFLDNVEKEYSYSDDESPMRVNVSRTRLNFNLAMSPTEEKSENVSTENIQVKSACSANDISKSCAGYNLPFRSNMEGSTTEEVSPPGSSYSAMITDERATSPAEAQFRFRLDAAQCSPILPHAENSRDFHIEDRSSPVERALSPVDEAAVKTNLTEDSKHSISHSSGHGSEGESSTCSSKLRRLRPMPDMSAFDAGASVRSTSSSRAAEKLDESGVLSLPKLTCPPTPVRTPAWAHNGNSGKPFVRMNSLIVTKVLASCPPPQVIMDGQSSLEDSFTEEINSNTTEDLEKWKASLSFATVEEDMEKSTDTCHPEQNESSDLSTPTQTETSELIPRDVAACDALEKPNFVPKTPFVPRSQPTKNVTKQSCEVVSFTADFENLGQLGRGTFADVYKVRSKSDQKLYAVKRNRRQFRGKRDRDLAMAEVRTMQKLQGMSTSCNSENSSKTKAIFSMYILFFYRAWQEEGYFYCQTAICCRDTCRELLESLRSNWALSAQRYPSMRKHIKEETKNLIDSPSQQNLTGQLTPESTIWKICHDIVSGLSHIHSHGIVHHDIKPSNIFFVSHFRLGAICKIGDFGMAGDIGTAEDGQEGDTIYMPPELLSSSVKHPSADIFSLGLTLYELASPVGWEMPVEGPRWHELRSGLHAPELSPSCHPDLSQLIKATIGRNQANRPSAHAILEQYPLVNGSSCRCDEFLRDYIHDVEIYDCMQEARLHQVQPSEQTPRNNSNAMTNITESYHLHQRELRTPTPGASSIPSSLLFTPNGDDKVQVK